MPGACRSQFGCPPMRGVALIWPALPRVPLGREWLEKGLLCAKQRCPPDPTSVRISREEHMAQQTAAETPRVVVGMDPHKRSVTIEVMAADETVLDSGRFGTDTQGHRAMLARVAGWPDRVWAIEGCRGIGRHIALRLVAEGERFVDVPPKPSARTRGFATGQGRQTDATDAHSVALVGTWIAGLRPVVNDEHLKVMRLLVDRRRSIGEEHTRKISQLHALLLELIPGGAKRYRPVATLHVSQAFGDVTPLPARGAVHRVFVALGPVSPAEAPWPEEFDRFELI